MLVFSMICQEAPASWVSQTLSGKASCGAAQRKPLESSVLLKAKRPSPNSVMESPLGVSLNWQMAGVGSCSGVTRNFLAPIL